MSVARAKERAVKMLHVQASDLLVIVRRAHAGEFWEDAERAARHLTMVFKALKENEVVHEQVP